MDYTWIGIIAGLLGIVAYIVKLAADYTRLKTQLEGLQNKLADYSLLKGQVEASETRLSELLAKVDDIARTQARMDAALNELTIGITALKVKAETRLNYMERRIEGKHTEMQPVEETL